MTSVSCYYRHGSPAPNYRPNNGLVASAGSGSGARRTSGGGGGGSGVTGGRMSPLGVTGNNNNFASSNNSVASNNSLGGSSMQAPPPRYASPAPGYGSSAGASSRYSSRFLHAAFIFDIAFILLLEMEALRLQQQIVVVTHLHLLLTLKGSSKEHHSAVAPVHLSPRQDLQEAMQIRCKP